MVPAGTTPLDTGSQVEDHPRTETDNGPVAGVVTHSPVVGRVTLWETPVTDWGQLTIGRVGMGAMLSCTGRALSSIASTAVRAVGGAPEIPRAESPGKPYAATAARKGPVVTWGMLPVSGRNPAGRSAPASCTAPSSARTVCETLSRPDCPDKRAAEFRQMANVE